MSSSYRIALDNWLRTVDVTGPRVLDIGGSQLPVKGRTRSWEAWEYIIADLESPHADSPKPDVIFDINYPAHESMGVFSTIFCLEVFDYVWNPVEALQNIYDYLDEGGVAWVTFPSFYPLHQPIEDDALRYMPGGIKKLAASVGLTIQEMIPRYTETDMLTQTWRAERMRAAKNQDHNISGWIVRFSK